MNTTKQAANIERANGLLLEAALDLATLRNGKTLAERITAALGYALPDGWQEFVDALNKARAAESCCEVCNGEGSEWTNGGDLVVCCGCKGRGWVP